LQGKHGDLVFKKINGKVFLTERAMSEKPRTQKQMRWQLRFKAASEFAKSVKATPDLLAFYGPLAEARKQRMRELVLSDAFDPPKIESIDLSQFTGQPGGIITVRATDNFGVVCVDVDLSGGEVADYGPAAPVDDLWRYTTTKPMPAGQPVTLRVTASDRPGNHTNESLIWLAAESAPCSPTREL
jgi:hypothetical protein